MLAAFVWLAKLEFVIGKCRAAGKRTLQCCTSVPAAAGNTALLVAIAISLSFRRKVDGAPPPPPPPLNNRVL